MGRAKPGLTRGLFRILFADISKNHFFKEFLRKSKRTRPYAQSINWYKVGDKPIYDPGLAGFLPPLPQRL